MATNKEKKQPAEKAAPEFDPKKSYSLIATESCKYAKAGTKATEFGDMAKLLVEKGWDIVDQ